DLAWVLAGDTVQHLAVRALLDEAGDLVGVVGETLPVDDGIGCVRNRKQMALLTEAGLSRHHGRRDRCGIDRAIAGGYQSGQQLAAERGVKTISINFHYGVLGDTVSSA